MVDYDELKKKLEQLAGFCSGLQYLTQYLPNEPEIDEPYKVHRTLVRLEDVDLLIQQAQQLDISICRLRESLRQVVHAPEALYR